MLPVIPVLLSYQNETQILHCNEVHSDQPVSAGALNGITRRVMFEIARDRSIPLREENLTRYEIYTADECFLTGTAAEVVPVAACDRRKIGLDVPGPVTMKFLEDFRRLTKNTGTPIYTGAGEA